MLGKAAQMPISSLTENLVKMFYFENLLEFHLMVKMLNLTMSIPS